MQTQQDLETEKVTIVLNHVNTTEIRLQRVSLHDHGMRGPPWKMVANASQVAMPTGGGPGKEISAPQKRGNE